MTAARCPTCDREGCGTAPLRAMDPSVAFVMEASYAEEVADCLAHAVDWRARALAAEGYAAALRVHIDAAGDGSNLHVLLDVYRARAERSEDEAGKAARTIDAILARLGARDTGAGGQTVEAGNARILHDGMRRLDRAIADAARWRKVAPLIEALRTRRRRAHPN